MSQIKRQEDKKTLRHAEANEATPGDGPMRTGMPGRYTATAAAPRSAQCGRARRR